MLVLESMALLSTSVHCFVIIYCYLVIYYLLQTMTPTPTYKNRMQKCRAKKKENVEKWKEYLEKDRLRNKRNREREKVACENYDNALKARREKIRLRVQAWRRKKALEKTNNGLLQTPLGTYKCKNTLHKAVSKACRALPYSPNKKKAVLNQLVKQSFGAALFTVKKPPATRRHSVDVRTVKDFYNSDEISWQTPGTRQFKSVKDKETGMRSHKQKRYLIMNISEAHQVFQEKFDVKISRSKFYDLRPENVFPVATTPHNVCVCLLHANFSFLIDNVSKSINSETPMTHNTLLNTMCCSLVVYSV